MFRNFNTISNIAKRNSSTFAKIRILGRVGQDPVAQQSTSGKDFLTYSVATNPTKEGPPSWFKILVFEGKQAEFTSAYVKKGALVHVEGNIVNSTFEKQDGTTGYSTSIFQTTIDIIRGAPLAEKPE